MQTRFEEDAQISSQEPLVVVKADQLVQNRLNSRNFIQVSRHTVINIDHLESLSDSFSGNMTAKLTNQLKTDVSRRYVKLLMDYLGI